MFHSIIVLFSEEKDIRARIKELIKYRRNGITKIEGVYKASSNEHSNDEHCGVFLFEINLWDIP